ncbi:MAG: MBL fold metallo-hydrolase, partial [Spirochaetaceae bacterium]|nr:MBL fold metallo-hydrolase [Spirochaetaceae bacterium]
MVSYSINFLGTGTSHGIPVIGCDCETCRSTNIKNKRYRSSVLFTKDNKHLLIDTTPEFRLQALRANVKNLDGVLYTHTHADHLNGIDDLRVFTMRDQLPFYGNKSSIEEIERRFSYVVGMRVDCVTSIPNLIPNILTPYKRVNISGFEVTP